MTETLASRTASLIEKTREAERVRRIAAGNELRELVARNSRPRKGDEERMIEAMGVLGLSAEELPDIVKLLEWLASSESLISQEDDAKQARREAMRDLKELSERQEAELQRFEQEAAEQREPLESKRVHAEQTLRQIEEARGQMSIHLPKWKSIVEQCTFEQAQAELYPRTGGPSVFAPRVSM